MTRSAIEYLILRQQVSYLQLVGTQSTSWGCLYATQRVRHLADFQTQGCRCDLPTYRSPGFFWFPPQKCTLAIHSGVYHTVLNISSYIV